MMRAKKTLANHGTFRIKTASLARAKETPQTRNSSSAVSVARTFHKPTSF